MAFRGKGVQSERDRPCWCGSVVIVTTGVDTDGNPYAFESCSKDVFHDVSIDDACMCGTPESEHDSVDPPHSFVSQGGRDDHVE